MSRTIKSLLRYLAAWTLVCVVPAAVMQFVFHKYLLVDAAVLNSAVASTIAFFLGVHISRQLFAFPGTRELTQGIWAIVAGFVTVAGILLVFRIPYSVYEIAYSLGVTVLLLIFWKDLFGKRPRNHFHLVPFGEVGSLQDLENVTLTTMERPVLPAASDASLVADLRCALPAEWERLLTAAALAGVPVYHYKLLQESIAGKVKIEHLAENNLGSLIPEQGYAEIKAIIDRVGAAILLPLLFPFLAIVALTIRLQDGGSVFYNQRRVGLGGKPFTIYKFRSMSMRRAAQDEAGERADAITRDNDLRITRFGAFIRKYRIDELPQIVNVLKGEMSFIGPRPEAIALAQWYDSELPFYAYRHIVRPGLTGWAQVNQGHVTGLESVNAKLQYDFYYVKYFSAWLDALIVLRTIRTILTGFGSK